MHTLSQIVRRVSFLFTPPASHELFRHSGAVALLCAASCFCAAIFASIASPAMANEQVRGRASWYGTTSHGKLTASGEVYNKDALTAAHRQLPFGSVVRIKNLKNGKQVLVQINDRGPFIAGRSVDVSVRAANLLRMTESGVIPVSIEIIGNVQGEPLKKDHAFFVHIANVAGAMQTRERMTALGNRLKMPLRAIQREQNGKPAFAVCSGPYATFQEAQRVFLTLEKKNFGLKGIIQSPVAENIFALRIAEAYEVATAANDLVSSHFPSYDEGTVFAILKNSFRVFSSISLHSGLLTLSLIQDSLPPLTESISFFTLPYQGHSGYTFLPS